MTHPADILVLNTGSSSVKCAVFDAQLQEQMSGVAEGIGGPGHLRVGAEKEALELPTHGRALAAILERLTKARAGADSLRAVAHRVVHGGTSLTTPSRVTSAVRAKIQACVPLAPLHNPHALSAIDALEQLAPDLPQYASFDTAFHADAPEVARRYALPPQAEALGLRRYGFHGLSYASICRCLPKVSGALLPSRLLAFHLGNGASICAIKDGRSVATTMGYSPLEGLTMGTRVGTLDPNATLRLVEEIGLTETKALLNNRSGLAGLSGGLSDMRALEEADTPEAQFAIAHFCYWAIRHGHSMIGAMGGCDAIVFTGGIGENARNIRARIMEGFGWLGCDIDPEKNARNAPSLTLPGAATVAWIVAAEEEREIAMNASALMEVGA